MAQSIEALASEVLRLSTADRSRLLNRVIASLDEDARRDAAWDAVAKSREAEIAVDPSALLSLDDVLRQLRSEVQ